MKTFSISELAETAGVSVHIARDHVVRGLVRPVGRTSGGYGVFDEKALTRLRFVRGAFDAGIGLRDLVKLCNALDGNHSQASASIDNLLLQVRCRRVALLETEAHLAALQPSGRARPDLIMSV